MMYYQRYNFRQNYSTRHSRWADWQFPLGEHGGDRLDISLTEIFQLARI